MIWYFSVQPGKWSFRDIISCCTAVLFVWILMFWSPHVSPQLLVSHKPHYPHVQCFPNQRRGLVASAMKRCPATSWFSPTRGKGACFLLWAFRRSVCTSSSATHPLLVLLTIYHPFGNKRSLHCTSAHSCRVFGIYKCTWGHKEISTA